MDNIFTFNKSVKGSSHDASGKPCQDYSLEKTFDGGCILIVCDGHGGDTYVRSDVGSRLAAEITCEIILEFVNTVPKTLFLDQSGSLTACPASNPLVDKSGKKVEFTSLTESQQEIALQIKSYSDNIKNVANQDIFFRKLFEAIYTRWIDAIYDDVKQNPFSEKEKIALGNHKLEKAYGSTLMAYVQTPLYWFAFHIGDGKIWTCDKEVNWIEPVPWDCACFLNITTSLCDRNPIPEFRYAFDGTGKFPSAVFLSSDGIDDSFITAENLQRFYTQTLDIFINSDNRSQTVSDLEEHLSKISKKGSHDDMSISALINIDEIQVALKLSKLRSEGQALKQAKLEKETELNNLQLKIEKLKSEKTELESLLRDECEGYYSWLKKIIEKFKQAEEERTRINSAISNIEDTLCKKRTEFVQWEPENKKRHDEILKERQEILNKIRIGTDTNEKKKYNSIKGDTTFSSDKDNKYKELADRIFSVDEDRDCMIIESDNN